MQRPVCIALKFVNKDFRNIYKYSGILGPHLQKNPSKVCSMLVIQNTFRKTNVLIQSKISDIQ